MKRILIIATTVLLLSALMSSCYSSKKCPAYSKADTEQTVFNS